MFSLETWALCLCTSKIQMPLVVHFSLPIVSLFDQMQFWSFSLYQYMVQPYSVLLLFTNLPRPRPRLQLHRRPTNPLPAQQQQQPQQPPHVTQKTTQVSNKTTPHHQPTHPCAQRTSSIKSFLSPILYSTPARMASLNTRTTFVPSAAETNSNGMFFFWPKANFFCVTL